METNCNTNKIEIFDYNNHKIRVVCLNNEPWFVGKDIATILKYGNTRQALASHVSKKDMNSVQILDGNRGNPIVTVINETGLYSLILGSKLPSAQKFKDWVTSEVLPSIQQHGFYMTTKAMEQFISDPENWFAVLKKLKEERDQKNEALAQKKRGFKAGR